MPQLTTTFEIKKITFTELVTQSVENVIEFILNKNAILYNSLRMCVYNSDVLLKIPDIMDMNASL